jgi:hypothetical protein
MDVDRIPSILLQTFLTVAEAGRISEAARRLHLSQPTVTGHIRRLEANLETTLFIRSANGVSLTERGAHLRERVQDVLAELEGDLAGAGSDPGSEWDSDSGGQHNCGEIFCAEDFHSLPSLPPGRRSSSDRWQHRRSAGPSSTTARGARASRGASA